MPLHLYRRHFRSGCPAGHKPDSQSYQSDELRPKWKKCGCPIYASGRLGDNPKFRKNTARVHWTEARAVAEAWERGDMRPSDPPPVPPPEKPRRTIAEAIQASLTEHEADGSALSTIRRYQCVLHKFQRFASDIKG